MEKLFLLHRWCNSLQKLEANNSVIFIMTIYSECQYDIDRFFSPLAKFFKGNYVQPSQPILQLKAKTNVPKFDTCIYFYNEESDSKYY